MRVLRKLKIDMNQKPSDNDEVLVHYRGMIEGKVEFDSSFARNEPFRFRLGAGQAVVGFENAVRDMVPGERRVVELGPDLAFGDHHEDLLVTIPKEKLPEGFIAEAGSVFEMSVGDDSVLSTVVEVTDDGVLIDTNHPLAGMKLTFEIELLKVFSAE